MNWLTGGPADQSINDDRAHARMQIKLSTKSFGRDAAEVAAAGVRNCAASLAHADLSDVIAGRPEAEALDALRIMCDALAHVQLRWGLAAWQCALCLGNLCQGRAQCSEWESAERPTLACWPLHC